MLNKKNDENIEAFGPGLVQYEFALIIYKKLINTKPAICMKKCMRKILG